MGGVLSIGIYEPGDEFIDDAIAVNANMVFLHDQALRLAAGIKARLPNIKIVGRPWLGNTEEQWGIINSSNARQWLHDHIAGLIGLYPDVDYFMGFNEVYSTGSPQEGIPPDFTTLRRQMEAERGLADACRERGRLACIYNGGPGTTPTKSPDDTARANWEPWCDIVVPMFTYPGVGLFGMHAYADALPKRYRDGSEWFICRHKFLFDGLREDGIEPPDTVLTEHGHGGDWARFLSEEQATDDYTWLGGEAIKERKMKGLFLFCDGDSGGWEFYSVHNTSIIPAMGAWNAAHPVAWEEPTGGDDMPTIEQEIAHLKSQNHDLVEALIALREGRLTGAGSVDGWIVSLRGGSLPADYKPVGPAYPLT